MSSAQLEEALAVVIDATNPKMYNNQYYIN